VPRAFDRPGSRNIDAPAHGANSEMSRDDSREKKGKGKFKRPPEPKVPALAKGTKGKKKGDKRSH
jgi:hypothetical protein